LGQPERDADGRSIVPVVVAGGEEVLSGEVELALPEEFAGVTVRAGELTDDFLLASSARNGRLQVAFAGAEGRGESGILLELVFDAGTAGRLEALQLERVELNEGRVEVASSALPLRNWLWPNYPNPFNPETTVCFELVDSTPVRLLVYALTGQRVRTLVDGELAGGIHAAVWNGRDEDGRKVASGVYLLKLEMGGYQAMRKMLLVR